MKILNKIKDWFLNLEAIKTLNYRMVWLTLSVVIFETIAFSETIKEAKDFGVGEILIPLIATILLLQIFAFQKQNGLKALLNLCKEHSIVIYTMIVVVVFQTLSVWSYNEPKMMIPQSLQELVLISLPLFKWAVFIHVLTLSRVNNEKENDNG